MPPGDNPIAVNKYIYYIILHWRGTAVPLQSLSRWVTVTVLLMPDAVDRVTRDPDDGWRCHPKHVERFADINKLYIVPSCWILTLDNKFQTIFCMNMLLIYLFASMKLEYGHKNDYFALVSKLCCTVLFYEIG